VTHGLLCIAAPFFLLLECDNRPNLSYDEIVIISASDCGYAWEGRVALSSNRKSLAALSLQNLACALLIGNLGSYSYAQPASGTATLAPLAYKTVIGKDNGQPAASSIDILDESGTVNVWAKYLQFQARSAHSTYAGSRDYYMTGDVASEHLIDLTVKVNYLGPLYSLQVWTWYIHNWTTNSWDAIGTNQASPGWGSWTILTFTPTGHPADYVRTSDGLIQIGTSSNNSADDADIDYESVIVNYSAKGK